MFAAQKDGFAWVANMNQISRLLYFDQGVTV